MITVLTGDCRDLLPTLPADSVHCVVTSPPYFGLRDYGTASWEGGDGDCDHRAPIEAGTISLQTMNGTHPGRFAGESCWRCGAIRRDRQIGLEATPDAFVAELVAVFREVRRVLRDDGTLWLNLGDSYNTAGTRHGDAKVVGIDVPRAERIVGSGYKAKLDGLKHKDMIGIPWRVAFALQADGWYLRQDIIWSKPNPMPESVTDRCTKAHEYVFLLTKRPRYFFDAEAIAEPITQSSETRNKRSVWTIATQPYAEAHFATFPPELAETCIKAGCPKGGTVLDPFGGAGTTGLVADRWQRNAILIELSEDYADMMRARLVRDAGMFAEIT